MKKLILTLCIVLISYSSLFAQWQNGTDIYNTNTGNVGIGITSPQTKLEVNGTGYSATKLLTLSESEPTRYSGYIGITVSGGTQLNLGTRNDNVNFDNTLNLFNGNVGIGTTSPFAKLDVKANTNARFFVTSTAIDHPAITFADIDNNPQYGTIKAYDLLVTNGINSLMKISSNGNVGIGTTNPIAAKLVLNSGSTNQNALVNGDQIGFTRTSDAAVVSYLGKTTDLGTSDTTNLHGYDGIIFRTSGTESARMTIANDGKVGIGTTSPSDIFEVAKTSASKFKVFTPWGYTYPADFSTGVIGLGLTRSDGVYTGGLYSYYSSSGDNIGIGSRSDIVFLAGSGGLGAQPEVMRIKEGGKIGIGTTNPDEKLTVKGKIHSQEVIVDAMTTVPDYVFEPTYKLPSLEEIKAYTDKNHHLPEIPSAKEIEGTVYN